MALAPAITDLEQLKDRPALARLLSWKAEAVTGAKFDRDELTIWVRRESLREVCILLRDDAATSFNFLADVTCVDWYPAEPRFEVVYSLLSMARKERIRIKVKLDSADPGVDSLTRALARRKSLRTRGLRPVRSPFPWPSLSPPHHDARGMGGPSAAQGLSG